jgi:hypothetical protein
VLLPDKKRLFYLSWLTLGGMSAIGILLINYLQHRDVSDTLTGGPKNYYLQTVTGLFFGSLAALLGLAFINVKRFKNVRTFFEGLVGEINPSLLHIFFYSFCAGVGEEILFRAGVQPLIGIWPAAMLFVFLHGYLNPTNMNMTIYGTFLIIVSAGFGYLFKYFGLLSSVIAHIIYDIAIFSVLKYSGRRR